MGTFSSTHYILYEFHYSYSLLLVNHLLHKTCIYNC